MLKHFKYYYKRLGDFEINLFQNTELHSSDLWKKISVNEKKVCKNEKNKALVVILIFLHPNPSQNEWK